MPWGGTPVGGLVGDDVVDESGKFGPEREALPEVGVDGDSEGEANEETENAGCDDGA